MSFSKQAMPIAKNEPAPARRNLWACLALLLLACTVYWPLTHCGFLDYDDQDYVTENPAVLRGLTWHGVVLTFSSTEAANWHPLTWLSHMLDVQLYGLRAGGHHLTSLLFHATNTLLLFFLLRQMTGAFWRSLFVAALFSIHPLHVESVAWIAERKDVLSTCWFLLTLLMYVRYTNVGSRRLQANPATSALRSGRRRPKSAATAAALEWSPATPGTGTRWARYTLALIFYALGLMSKPMLVTLPFILLLLDYWPIERLQGPRLVEDGAASAALKTFTRLLIEKIPFFLLSLAVCIITFRAQSEGSTVADVTALPLGARAANAFVSYWRYCAKTIWPADLSIFYPHPGTPALGPVILGLLVVLGVSFLALVRVGREPWLFVGWFWFLGTLVPVIGLVQVGVQSMADRYTYIPLIGLFILFAWFAPQCAERLRLPRGSMLAAGAVSILVYAAVSARQLTHWKDSESIFRQATHVTPDNYMARYNLALALEKKDRREEAGAEFDTLAKQSFDQGQLGVATGLFKRALDLRPNDPEAHQNLASVLATQGQLDDAIALYEQALRLKPDYAGARTNLNAALAQRSAWINASSHYEAGATLLQQGKPREAIDEFQQALSLRPDWPEVLNNLAWLLATHPSTEVRDGVQAVSLANRACALSGSSNVTFLSTLAAAYAETRQFPEAIRIQEQVATLAASQTNSPLTREMRERLDLYRSSQPFHRR